MDSIVARAQHGRPSGRAALGVGCALVLALAVGTAPAAAASAQTGSLTGHLTAPSADSSTMVPVAGITVTATSPAGTTYRAITADDGFYELDQLPAPASYTVTFVPSQGQQQTLSAVAVAVGTNTTADATLDQPVATVAGTVTDQHHRPLPGMPVGLSSVPSVACPAGAICGPSTTSGADGTYALSVVPGNYELDTLDAGQVVGVQPVDAVAGTRTSADVHLAMAAIPAGTTQAHAARDLRRLNAERRRAGLPTDLVLNPRWSLECAAHDGYERANGVLSHTENPQASGASAGGAWAGLVSLLAQSRWTQAADPWQNAPIHLMQLFTPSLSVIGIDDSGGLQCATTYPGLLRAPVASDTVTTYPADGARGIPPREVAREAPFVPGQFVGIPAGQAAGRELFVYLNESGQTGQAQVKVTRATLSLGGRAVALRWVDNSTRTVGRYLTGAILIPVRPLRAHSAYRATVVVQDRSGTVTHSWSFTTGGG
ncbi:MAG TPA: carboxypeptidase-like regulatory domain-containing protein [Solirubrobacteraceae bacterium]|nr:carboxypeptidase-like regulatory domain-containing protein [Solirubrobacteraceae bacterium]